MSEPKTESSKESHSAEPYASLLSEVVARIRDQPFLFVIAIAALVGS